MRSDDFYRAKAEACEREAASEPDEKVRDRLLKTAADWRNLISSNAPGPKPR